MKEFRGQYTYLMRGILALTYLLKSLFAQNACTNDETASSSLIGILSPDITTPVTLVLIPCLLAVMNDIHLLLGRFAKKPMQA